MSDKIIFIKKGEGIKVYTDEKIRGGNKLIFTRCIYYNETLDTYAFKPNYSLIHTLSYSYLFLKKISEKLLELNKKQ